MNARCKICGFEWDTTADSLLHNTKGCKRCNKTKTAIAQRKTNEEFEAQLQNINPNITLLTKYETAKSRVTCKCKLCGNEWSAIAYNLLTGYGCPKCGRMKTQKANEARRLSLSDVKERVAVANPNVEIIGEYISYNDPILCRCIACGNEWYGRIHNLLKNEGCPHCRYSHGEKEISKYFVEHNIEYIYGMRFDDLRGKKYKLQYDFYLPKYNALIEYQGIQHSKPVSVFGGDESFSRQLKHDKMKELYAKENGYDFLAIWHYDIHRIDEVLNDFLNNTIIPVSTTA